MREHGPGAARVDAGVSDRGVGPRASIPPRVPRREGAGEMSELAGLLIGLNCIVFGLGWSIAIGLRDIAKAIREKKEGEK